MGKKKSRADRHDEPSLPAEGWFHYGDDALWIVDYTEGGAPYGPTRAEMREALEPLARPRWVLGRLRRALTGAYGRREA